MRSFHIQPGTGLRVTFIHTTVDQVVLLAFALGEVFYDENGQQCINTPEWIENMLRHSYDRKGET